MATTDLCQLCGSAPAVHGCEACGALVCEDHYEHRRGVCTACASSGGRRL